MRIMTIIPAKSNSNRLPGKNKKLLCGTPLFVHSINHAKNSKVCGDIYVATDDEEIAQRARKEGAIVPFLRTTKDTDDFTSVGEACSNFIKQVEVELNKKYDLVCVLLTTSPLRLAQDIKNAHDLLVSNQSQFDSVTSLIEGQKHPYWSFKLSDDLQAKAIFPKESHLDRHQLPKDIQYTYHIDGSIYWANVESFKKFNGDQYSGNIGGYVVKAENAIDIDTAFDFKLCEFFMKEDENNA